MSIFDTCTDSCGWAAAIYALLAYGTYGCAIKETKNYNVHPLILQSYKTIIMFAFSFVILSLGAEWKFTSLGIVSGALWVSGGTCGIAAVRLCGMAVAVGTWSSVMVIINFLFGVLVFQEPIHDFGSACGAFALLTVGLAGMSKYGVAEPSGAELEEATEERERLLENSPEIIVSGSSGSSNSVHSRGTEEDGEIVRRTRGGLDRGSDCDSISTSSESPEEPLEDPETTRSKPYVLIGGVKYSKKVVGAVFAILNGVLAGTSLIPVHYAKKRGFGGANYYFSYASGALLANCGMWLIYMVVLCVKYTEGDFRVRLQSSLNQLPKWYLMELWKPGLLAGFLLATAMFGSIMTVTYLGQGVGNSIIQAKIIVSGMWGIFYYREISNQTAIRWWFCSALLSVTGIIWLSQQRVAAKQHHRFLLWMTE